MLGNNCHQVIKNCNYCLDCCGRYREARGVRTPNLKIPCFPGLAHPLEILPPVGVQVGEKHCHIALGSTFISPTDDDRRRSSKLDGIARQKDYSNRYCICWVAVAVHAAAASSDYQSSIRTTHRPLRIEIMEPRPHCKSATARSFQLPRMIASLKSAQHQREKCVRISKPSPARSRKRDLLRPDSRGSQGAVHCHV